MGVHMEERIPWAWLGPGLGPRLLVVGHVFKCSIMCASNLCPSLFVDTVFYLMCVVSRNVWAVVKKFTLCWKLFCYSDLYSRYCCIIDGICICCVYN